MGPAFVLLFWLILAGIFALFWAASLVIFIVGLVKKKKWLKWLGFAPLAGLTLLALLVGSVFGVGVMRAISPKYVFTDTFGEKPGSDITNIKSKVWSFADTADVHLQFQTSSETFQRLLPKELKRVAFEEFLAKASDYNHAWPDWWQPINGSTTEIYWLNTSLGEKGRKFSTERILMTYDQKMRLAQYCYLGID
jgi:hypothetical protein